ncbi:MAG: pimeloyl-CoA dehydrogenase small subunit, partial [Rhodoferax sp.]|nr:pimeloyl-CoA dehydrogenase small subunit [Rhodoferax sp.]
MNFEHTEDRRMLADTLGRFVAEQYGFETRNAIAYGDTGMAPALWARFAELGTIGALFPEADGGFGGGGFDVA